MSRTLMCLLSACLLLVTVAGTRAVTLTVGSDADTYVSDETPHGDAAYMYLNAAANSVGYVRFDLSGLNVLTVQSATLTLMTSGGAPRNDNVVTGRFILHGLDNVAGNTPQNWDETALSSANVGAEWSTNGGDPLVNTTNMDETVQGITESVVRVGANYWDPGAIEITVSGDPLVSFIQSRVDEGGLVTFLLEFPGADGRGFGLASKENENEEYHPVLVLEATTGARTAAVSPSPADGATDVWRDAVLGWAPGVFAATHNVYLSTNLDDVTAASAAALVSEGQAAATHDPAGSLQYGQTYYWRIDEVNGAPDFMVYDGEVWSFTVEPVAYPLENVTATASISGAADKGPENTVNRSGLDEEGQHGTSETTMWQGDAADGDPVWIQFEFEDTYKLHDVRVWNYNMGYEFVLGFGIKDVTIEYATDANEWTTLGDFSVPQAPGTADYTGTTLNLGGIAAKYVRMNILDNWGTQPRYGLSEVEFSYIPVVAREPMPVPGATGVDPDVVLSWRAGREAASHEVHFGTDANAVAQGAALLDTVPTSTYDLGTLDLDTTYYWRITEVNEAETPVAWTSDAWSFTTPAFILVDGFEGYTDDEGSLIYEAWADGFNVPGNGSQVGHDNQPYAEQTAVRSGNQAMPFYYGKEGATTSEATLTLDSPQDWTRAGVQTLVIYFQGVLGNPTGQLYAKINGTRVDYPGSTASLAAPLWQQWNIDLAALGNSARNVTTLTIGISSSGEGRLYVDDIRLYKAAPALPEAAVDPGVANLVAHYTMEDSVADSSGNGYSGTAQVGSSFGQGPAGYGRALVLDGTSGYAELPVGPLVQSLNSTTLASWVNYAGTGGVWQRIFDFGNSTDMYLFLTPNGGGGLRFAITTAGTGGESTVTASDALATGWHHVAVTIDSVTAEMTLYEDGIVVADGTTETLPADLGNTTQNWLGRSQYEADPYFNGSIDDLRIYNRVLSMGEIRYLVGAR